MVSLVTPGSSTASPRRQPRLFSGKFSIWNREHDTGDATLVRVQLWNPVDRLDKLLKHSNRKEQFILDCCFLSGTVVV